MKNFVKAMSRSMGLYMRLLKNIPFGVEWCQDVKYLMGDIDLELVVDVGANIGQTVYEVIKYFPNSYIYSFEPIPTTFKQLVERTKAFPNVFHVNAALGDQSFTSPMTAKPLAQQNTLVFDVKEAMQNDIETDVVQVDTLDHFCTTNKINKINLLKVDTEGYEMKVLRGAEQLLSSDCIDYILIECDFFKRRGEPHGDFVEILNYLQNYRYNVVAFYTGGVDNLGWKWGDVLFRKMTSEQAGFTATSPFRQHGV